MREASHAGAGALGGGFKLLMSKRERPAALVRIDGACREKGGALGAVSLKRRTEQTMFAGATAHVALGKGGTVPKDFGTLLLIVHQGSARTRSASSIARSGHAADPQPVRVP